MVDKNTNNDIKEILDYFKKYVNDKYETYTVVDKHTQNLKILLNYISDLQEENKEWEMTFDAFSSRPYAHRYLEEKRKELNNPHIIGLDSEMIYKDYYDLKEEHNKCTRKHWQQKCAEHCTNEMIYKSRSDKAIEYIEDNMSYVVKGNKEYIPAGEELLDILRGKDNDK